MILGFVLLGGQADLRLGFSFFVFGLSVVPIC